MKTVNNCVEKCINLRGHREEEPYSRRICIMDVRIFLITKREHPPTNQSKRSEGYEETRGAKCEDTRRVNIDFVIQGLPHSTVQKEDYDRREMVKKLIHQFDTHPNCDSLMEDLNKTEEFNQFIEKSKALISSMGNTERIELCGISCKIQCPDCALYWDVGIVFFCTCGKCPAAVGEKSIVEQR